MGTVRTSQQIELSLNLETWPLASPLSITGHTFTELPVLVVSLRQDGFTGRGEAAGVYYRDDTPVRMAERIVQVRDRIEEGINRESLQRLMPAGGARNALDCALWDLEACRAGRPVWELAGIERPRPLLTTYTLSADTPERMAAMARAHASARALKLKLTAEETNAERVRAVRAARPDVWMAVDANQGCTLASLEQLLPVLVEADVRLIEQPLPVGRESELLGFASPIPIAADESVQHAGDIGALIGKFQMINIKLDKCGGLTEGLAMAERARSAGLQVMVGNMMGTALAMAPAVVLGQLCDVVDLDGPLFLASDRTPATVYESGYVSCPEAIWGHPIASSGSLSARGDQP